MNLSTHLNTQQSELVSTTEQESPLQLSLSQEEPGQTYTEPTKVCRDCGGTFTYDKLIKRDGKHRAPRSQCINCAKKTSQLLRDLKKQNSKPDPHYCKGCGKWLEKKDMVLHHNHRTNKFITYICDRCNLAMGHADDNPNTLLNLWYLTYR